MLLSLLPMAGVEWLYQTASSNFVSVAAAPGRGPQRRIRAYGYGAAPAEVSLFVVVSSHGDDVHVGINVGCHITDLEGLTMGVVIRTPEEAQLAALGHRSQ